MHIGILISPNLACFVCQKWLYSGKRLQEPWQVSQNGFGSP